MDYAKNIAKLFLLTAALLEGSSAVAQQQRRVQIVGNSYTEVNNLPAMVQQVIASEE